MELPDRLTMTDDIHQEDVECGDKQSRSPLLDMKWLVKTFEALCIFPARSNKRMDHFKEKRWAYVWWLCPCCLFLTLPQIYGYLVHLRIQSNMPASFIWDIHFSQFATLHCLTDLFAFCLIYISIYINLLFVCPLANYTITAHINSFLQELSLCTTLSVKYLIVEYLIYIFFIEPCWLLHYDFPIVNRFLRLYC